MSSRQRQLDELRRLCGAGDVVRAVDLAFEHFARFGRDDDVIALLAAAVEGAPAPGGARQRLTELRAGDR